MRVKIRFFGWRKNVEKRLKPNFSVSGFIRFLLRRICVSRISHIQNSFGDPAILRTIFEKRLRQRRVHAYNYRLMFNDFSTLRLIRHTSYVSA